MEKHENSVKKNYFYNLFYQILCIIVPFITTPYISRVLGPENSGICSFVSANVTYFSMIGINGLATYAQLEVAKKRNDEAELKQFFSEGFITKLITMSFSIMIYTVIYIIRPNPYRIYYIIQLSVLICNLIDVSWLFQGVEDFKTVTIQHSIVRILSVVAIFLLVKERGDLYLYFIINGFGALTGYLLVLPRLKKYVSFGFVRKPNIKKHLRNSFQYFLPAIASTLISTTDKLMLGWNLSSKVQNGYYEKAAQIERMIFMVFASLSLSLRPRMAYLSENGRYEEIKERMRISLQFVSALVFPVAMGLIAIADLFVPIFFGQEYMPVIALLKIMAFWIICKVLSNCFFDQYILPNRGAMTAAKLIWFSAILNIFFNAILIPKFEAVGATVASLATEIVFLTVVYYASRKTIGIAEYIRMSWKYIVAAGIMFLVLWKTKAYFSGKLLGMFYEVGAGATLYMILLFLMGDKFVFEQINGFIKEFVNKK